MNEKSKLLWHCRRGIRELDILLREFIEQHYEQLQESDKNAFSTLLNEADLDIFNWIMAKDTPLRDELKRITAIIRQTRRIA